MKNIANGGALILVMLLWGLHLGYPMNLLQNERWALLGQAIPVYYFFVVLTMLGAAAAAAAFKRRWSKWELLWWALPLICLPGIAFSADRLWSLRQCLSWIVRGVIPGGVIFLVADRRISGLALRYWIYPMVIAASLLGLREIYSGHNPFFSRYDHNLAAAVTGTAQPANPFYRPHDDFGSYLLPRGTQGNRIPYAASLVGFLPLGLWLLKYKRRFYWAHLASVGILVSIILLAQVRGVWAGMLAAVILMRAFGLQRNRRESGRFLAGAAACLALFLAWPKTRTLLWTRLNSFHLADGSIRLRLDLLQTASVLKERWFAGVGFGQFPTACKPYYHGAMTWIGTADDQYLRWVTENGIPALLLLLVFFVGLARAGWAKIQLMKDPEQADFYKSLLTGWISIAVTFLIFDGFYWGACNMTFWSLLGLFATCLAAPEPTAS